MKRTLATVFLCLMLATPAWAGFDEGAAAYERGDYAMALREFRPLAQQGHAHAQFYLGSMYDKGQGVARDDAKAVKWYRKAAEQGLAEAQFNLGYMYTNGRGVPNDDAKAVKWYGKAAKQGFARAQFNLGIRYSIGLGVTQDNAMAAKWYRWFPLRVRRAAVQVGQLIYKVRNAPLSIDVRPIEQPEEIVSVLSGRMWCEFLQVRRVKRQLLILPERAIIHV